VLIFALFALAPAALLALIWMELRSGRTAPYVAFAARRSARPWLYWSQVAGHILAMAVLLYLAGAAFFASLTD